MLYRSVSGYSIENSVIFSSRLPKRNGNLSSLTDFKRDFQAGTRSFSELNRFTDYPACFRSARVKNAPYSSAEVSEKAETRRSEGPRGFPAARLPFEKPLKRASIPARAILRDLAGSQIGRRVLVPQAPDSPLFISCSKPYARHDFMEKGAASAMRQLLSNDITWPYRRSERPLRQPDR